MSSALFYATVQFLVDDNYGYLRNWILSNCIQVLSCCIQVLSNSDFLLECTSYIGEKINIFIMLLPFVINIIATITIAIFLLQNSFLLWNHSKWNFILKLLGADVFVNLKQVYPKEVVFFLTLDKDMQINER